MGWNCGRGWCSAPPSGEGVVLDGDGKPFHDALARPAEPAEVAEWLATIRPARATLPIGELLLAPGVPATLDAGGFDRHTFLCGQSGSGKTYSLGLVLERLLVETDLRLIILDPNSDYVRLGEQRAEADAELAAGYADAAKGVVVRRAGEGLHAPTRPARPERPCGRAGARPGGRSRGVRARRPVARRRHHLRRAGDVGGAARAGASAQSGEPRRAELAAVGARQGGVARRRHRATRRALSRRRPRLSGDARGASRRRGGGARNALAAPRRPRARADRDRRGAQRLPADSRTTPSRRS